MVKWNTAKDIKAIYILLLWAHCKFIYVATSGTNVTIKDFHGIGVRALFWSIFNYFEYVISLTIYHIKLMHNDDRIVEYYSFTRSIKRRCKALKDGD
jgi:hypothetical protein